MKEKNVMRIVSVAANALLLCAGSAILLAIAPFRSASAQGDHVGVGIFALITCLLLFVIFIIEVASALRISSSTFHTAFIALFLLICAAFHPDMMFFYKYIGVSGLDKIGEAAGELSFVAVEIALLCFFRYTYRIGGRRLPLYPLLIAGALDAAVYFFLFSKSLKIFAHLFFLVVIVAYFIILQVRSYLAGVDNATFAFASAIFFSCAGMHTANTLFYGRLAPYLEGLSSAYLWVCILCFVSIYMVFFVHIDSKASRAEDYKLQNERLKMKVLMGQIKPHFISNALTTIKSCYHGDVQKGDDALDLFSEYIRNSLLMIDTEVIPFEQELQNISRYVEFINISRIHPFRIIYDIDVTDFNVPAFALQTFIENAVKYSKVNEKEDGYIMISTSAEKEYTVIRITDNGAGFDSSQIKAGAHGISNSRECFKLLFHTEPVIKSIPDVGTEITIRIRRTEEENKG